MKAGLAAVMKAGLALALVAACNGKQAMLPASAPAPAMAAAVTPEPTQDCSLYEFNNGARIRTLTGIIGSFADSDIAQAVDSHASAQEIAAGVSPYVTGIENWSPGSSSHAKAFALAISTDYFLTVKHLVENDPGGVIKVILPGGKTLNASYSKTFGGPTVSDIALVYVPAATSSPSNLKFRKNGVIEGEMVMMHNQDSHVLGYVVKVVLDPKDYAVPVDEGSFSTSHVTFRGDSGSILTDAKGYIVGLIAQNALHNGRNKVNPAFGASNATRVSSALPLLSYELKKLKECEVRAR
ncbi:TPA: trypsin-like peptidase domain-containing protein [Candidatus Woesearchaeota archaeon]|nr:trypsin-like peptidase domain-containing protein [Candidatus Woesearchaeota archaeon]